MNESFATPAALRKAQREVAEFQRWQHLGQQIGGINQKICALRPVEEEGSDWTSQEKRAVAIHQEFTREINLLLTRIFAQRHKTGDMDLQAVERTAEATPEAKLGCAFTWVQLLFMRPVVVWHSAFKFMRVNS